MRSEVYTSSESLKKKYHCMNKVIQELIKFRNERDWEQFHNPKDLAIAINVEAGELLELFLWKDAEDAKKEKIKEELADVFAYALLLAEKYNFDVEEIILDKIKKNGIKYPIDKSKGTAKKYNEL
ncbi:MAG: nucleotide pyrophosphohydrolase [Saonia sp.]